MIDEPAAGAGRRSRPPGAGPVGASFLVAGDEAAASVRTGGALLAAEPGLDVGDETDVAPGVARLRFASAVNSATTRF